MAEPLWKERPPAGFQRGAYTQLPAIPATNTNSPQPAPDTQIVPFNGTHYNRKPVGRFPSPSDLYDAEEKVRGMEMRLNVTEKSNRALLDEVLRLQNELKVTVKKNEDTLIGEKLSRQQLEASLKNCNDLILQLSSRIKGTEEKLAQEQTHMTSLVHHTKGVEQAVMNSQQELKSKKDTQSSRVQELENGVLEVKLGREKLEKNTQEIMNELRALKTKVDIQGTELSAAATELKSKTKRLEDDTRVQVEVLRKHGDQYSQSEHATVHLRGQVESRLSELRDVIIDLRTKQDQESSERRTLEQQLQLKMNELQQGLAEQTRKREEAIHALDMLQREKEHEIETEKLKLQSKLTEGVEDVNKRLLTKEIKLREEMQDKFLQLEKIIQQDQKGRREFEKNNREETDIRWDGLKKQIDDEIGQLREIMKGDYNKNKETLKKLDEGLNLLEKQLGENRKQVDKVLTAEIKSRKVHESTTNEKIDGVQQKLQVATSALQQAIGGVNSQLTNNNDMLKDEVRNMVTESEQANTRTMTDMDTRITALNKKMTNLNDQIEKKITDANVELSKTLKDQVESLNKWKVEMGDNVEEMDSTLKQIPNDIYAVEEKQKLLKSDLDTRVSAEADVRIKDVQDLKKQIKDLKDQTSKPPKQNGPTVEEMEKLNSSVRQLGESIQTVKTVLTMKIQSEQKLRVDELKGLQEEIAKLRTQVEPLVRKNTPDNKNKDDDDGNYFVKGSQMVLSVNKWGVYNVYRWLTWKSKWKQLSEKNKNLPADLEINKTPQPTESRNSSPQKNGNTPKPESKTIIPAPNTPIRSQNNSPQPRSKINTPASDSKRNTPNISGNSPEPETKAPTPKPADQLRSPAPPKSPAPDDITW